jgi:hypothetical protein
MRSASIVFVLLFSFASLNARGQAGAMHPLYVQPPTSQACPVGLSATREPGGPLHSVDKTFVSGGRQLRINFTTSASQTIAKADIVVHGVKTLSGYEGLLLTGPSVSSQNNTESFQLVGSAAAPLLHPVIATRSMTAINWLELTRIEYADGKVWQASPESRCAAAPSLLVLVDGGK